jgi:hypothetical protein
MLVQVNGTDFKRDINSMALVNSDANGLNEYLTKRKLVSTQKQEINNIKSEMVEIKSDITEIKSLLRQLLEKDSNG